MLKVLDQRAKKVASSALLALLLVFGIFLSYLYITRQIKADSPNIINVTTTVDENSDPGTGCSLYEATMAVNTDTAYGGCTAGSATVPNVISLPAGTYARDDTSGPLGTGNFTLDVHNASIIGVGKGQTIIQGFWFSLSGNDSTSLENMSLTMPSSYNNMSTLYIAGSNKTINNVDMSNGQMIPVYVYLSPGGETVNNTSFTNFSMLANSGTNPSSVVDCYTSNACNTILFDTVDISSQFSTNITLADVPNVTMKNSSVTAGGGGPSVTLGSKAIVDGLMMGTQNPGLVVGNDSSIKNTVLSSDSCGGNAVTVNTGTVVDGLTQNNTGCGVTLQGSAASVSNVTHNMSGGGQVIFNVDTPQITNYRADTVSNQVIFADANSGASIAGVYVRSVYVIDFNSQAASMSNIDLQTSDPSGYLSFTNNHDAANISKVKINNSAATSGSSNIQTTIAGNNVVVDDLSVTAVSNNTDHYVNFTGQNPTITNYYANNIRGISFTNPSSLNLSNFTITNSNYYPVALYIDGDAMNLNISNGYINNAVSGIYVTNTTPGNSNVNIHNTQIENMTGAVGSNTGIMLQGMTTSMIDNATIRGAEIGISINDGTTHNVKNSTIVSNASGIALAGTSSPAVDLYVNNSTIVNNGSLVTPGDQGPLAGSSTGSPVTIHTSNSIIGGTDGSDLCQVVGDVTYKTSNSFATDPSCTGFTQVPSLDGIVATTLADNGSKNAAIGYKGTFGNLWTLALPSTSSAISAGNVGTCEATDARGMERDLVKGCDLGAFQFNVVIPVVPLTKPVTTNVHTTVTYRNSGTSTDTTSPVTEATPSTPSANNNVVANNNPSDTNTQSNDSNQVVNMIIIIASIVGGAVIVIFIASYTIRFYGK